MKLTGEFDFATKTRRVRDSQLNLREHFQQSRAQLSKNGKAASTAVRLSLQPLHVFPSRLSVFVVNQFLNLFAPLESELRLRLHRFAIHFNDGINHEVDR